jgi:O-antigen ligase
MIGLILTYILTYGGAIVGVFNPFVGVCIFWLFDIVRPQYLFSWAGLQGDFSQTIAIATIAGWVLKRFGNWNLGRGKLIFGLYIANGVWVILSALAAPDHDVALPFVIEQVKRTLMFTIAVTTADSLKRMERLAWVMTASAGYVGFELNMRYFEGSNEAHRLGYAGMDNNCLAISMVTCLGVAVFLGLYVRAWWQKAIALTAAAFIGHTVLLTFSRGGLLGLIVAGAAALAVIPKRPRYLVPIGAGALLAVALTGAEVRDRFMTSFSEERDFSAQSRVDLWLDCITVMQAYPLLGAGPDHFPLIADEFGWPEGKEAHSLWLQVGAEIGIPGVLFLLLFYLTAMRRLWPLARGSAGTDDERWIRCAACMVVTALAGFIVSVQFVTMEGLETPLYVAALAIVTLRHEGWLQVVQPITAALESVASSRLRRPAAAVHPGPRWAHRRV